MCHFREKFKGKFTVKVKGKGRAVSVHIKKTYKGSEVTAPRILITSAVD
jgi:hypothetical protein